MADESLPSGEALKLNASPFPGHMELRLTDLEQASLLHVSLQEFHHQFRDRFPIFLKGEVTRIQDVEIQILQIAFVRMSASFGKDGIVLAPDDEGRGLVRPQVLLPLRIERRITSVGIEHGQLNFLIAFAVEQRLIHIPIVRTYSFGIPRAVRVLPPGGI